MRMPDVGAGRSAARTVSGQALPGPSALRIPRTATAPRRAALSTHRSQFGVLYVYITDIDRTSQWLYTRKYFLDLTYTSR